MYTYKYPGRMREFAFFFRGNHLIEAADDERATSSTMFLLVEPQSLQFLQITIIVHALALWVAVSMTTNFNLFKQHLTIALSNALAIEG